MKKVTQSLIALCVLVVLSVSVYATPQPVSVEMLSDEYGALIMKKTFELPPEIDPQMLEQPFEQDGYSFVFREVISTEATSAASARLTSKTAAIVSDTDNLEEVIQRFPDTIVYEQDGYTGRLRLDATSLEIEADEFETFTYSFTRTRDIPGLGRNDPALVEREWNGKTLDGLTFRRGADGRYTATATYRGLATSTRPVSFIATVSYYGEVSRISIGNTLYTVIFEGTAIDVQEMPDTVETPTDEAARGLNLLPIVAGVAVVVSGIVAAPHIKKILRKVRSNSNETINRTKRFIRKD